MNRSQLKAIALALSATFAAGASVAQTSATQPPVTSPAASPAKAVSGTALSSSDRKFVTTAAEAGAAEVAMGKLAKDKATSADVKDFASHMVSDHQKAGDELKAIATSKGMTPSDKLSTKDQAAMDKLSKLQGADFDKAYVNSQVSAHKDAVSLFSSESKSGKDSDLKQFASTTLPTLQEHKQMVDQLAKSAPNKMSSTGGAAKPASKS